MMEPKFKVMHGKVYVRKHITEIEPEDEIYIGCISDPDSINNLKKIFDDAEKEAKERKLEEVMQELKDKMQEHVVVILHELVHAMHNHPNHEWPWKSFDFVHQTAVMMEEAGEAVRAANNMRTGDENQMALYNELAQTAAMCLRIMEQIKEYSVYGEIGN